MHFRQQQDTTQEQLILNKQKQLLFSINKSFLIELLGHVPQEPEWSSSTLWSLLTSARLISGGSQLLRTLYLLVELGREQQDLRLCIQ